MRFLGRLSHLQAARRARAEDLQTARKARVDNGMEATRKVLEDAEAAKAQLRPLIAELADYVADLRALTITLATVRKHERSDS